MDDETLILCNYSEKYKAAVEDYFAEAESALENAREDVYGGFSYTLLYIRENDSRLLGLLNLRPELAPDEADELGHIGYMIRPSERGRGYGSMLIESGVQLLNMQGVLRIKAVVREGNIAGERVLVKNGFKRLRSAAGYIIFIKE